MTYLHHRWSIDSGVRYIGGMYTNFALKGESIPPTEIVPAAKQREILGLLLDDVDPASLAIPETSARQPDRRRGNRRGWRWPWRADGAPIRRTWSLRPALRSIIWQRRARLRDSFSTSCSNPQTGRSFDRVSPTVSLTPSRCPKYHRRVLEEGLWRACTCRHAAFDAATDAARVHRCRDDPRRKRRHPRRM